MKSTFGHRHWVFGFYDKTDVASHIVQLAKDNGFSDKHICILTPKHIRKKTFSGIRVESENPEIAWMAKGALIGAFAAAVLGWIVSGDFMAGNMRFFPALFTTLGGALMGGFFAILSSGSDASLYQDYNDGEHKEKGEILVGLSSDQNNQSKIQTAKKLIEASGAMPHELP